MAASGIFPYSASIQSCFHMELLKEDVSPLRRRITAFAFWWLTAQAAESGERNKKSDWTPNTSRSSNRNVEMQPLRCTTDYIFRRAPVATRVCYYIVNVTHFVVAGGFFLRRVVCRTQSELKIRHPLNHFHMKLFLWLFTHIYVLVLRSLCFPKNIVRTAITHVSRVFPLNCDLKVVLKRSIAS